MSNNNKQNEFKLDMKRLERAFNDQNRIQEIWKSLGLSQIQSKIDIKIEMQKVRKIFV